MDDDAKEGGSPEKQKGKRRDKPTNKFLAIMPEKEVYEGGEHLIQQASNSSRYLTVEHVKERIDRCLDEIADIRTHINKQAENLEELKIKYTNNDTPQSPALAAFIVKLEKGVRGYN